MTEEEVAKIRESLGSIIYWMKRDMETALNDIRATEGEIARAQKQLSTYKQRAVGLARAIHLLRDEQKREDYEKA